MPVLRKHLCSFASKVCKICAVRSSPEDLTAIREVTGDCQEDGSQSASLVVELQLDSAFPRESNDSFSDNQMHIYFLCISICSFNLLSSLDCLYYFYVFLPTFSHDWKFKWTGNINESQKTTKIVFILSMGDWGDCTVLPDNHICSYFNLLSPFQIGMEEPTISGLLFFFNLTSLHVHSVANWLWTPDLNQLIEPG